MFIATTDLHLWYAKLNSHDLTWAQQIVSAEEHLKAEDFLEPRKQQRFLLKRAILRTVLSNYLTISTRELKFSTTSFGKPFLTHQEKNIFFNLSDSEDQLAIVVSQHQDIGIDIEMIKTRPDYLVLAQRFFSDIEIQYLMNADEQQIFFHRLWTQKEAVMKASGLGFNMSLKRFSVNGDINPRLIKIEHDDPDAWFLYHFSLASSCVGAIALRTNIDKSTLKIEQYCFNNV